MRSQDQPPAELVEWFRRHLLEWFAEEGREFPWRLGSYDIYHMVVSEVLLQRTRAEVVAGFIGKFFDRFPSWADLATASEEEIGVFLRPIGLWRRRAAGLKNLGTEMVRRGGIFPRERNELESIPAIGQYIANAALLFVHGQAEPLLDVNMARVLERFFGPRVLADIRYDPYLQALARTVVAEEPIKVNWAVLDFAAKICRTPIPRCSVCPLQSRCRFAQNVAIASPAGTKLRPMG